MNVNIHDAKTHLSRYLEEMDEDEVITICKRNTPVAELRKLGEKDGEARPLGLAAGEVEMKGFDDPLPPEILREFNGERG